MKPLKGIQLSQLVDTSQPSAVLEEVKANFVHHYPVSEFAHVREAFNVFNALYEGGYPGYGKCNTKYHDKLHTTDALLAISRLMDGYNIRNKKFSVSAARIALIATMFHDSGYIQKRSDHKGTGAKFTLNHVERSIEFLKKYLTGLGYSRQDTKLAGSMVQCTGLNMSVYRLSFRNKPEKILALMLGTSDLIGQMSSRTYLEKLSNLYSEFKEGHVSGYDSPFDLFKKTGSFYSLMKVRLEKDLENVQRYAKFHFNARYRINKNLYLTTIDSHMEHLVLILKNGPKRFSRYLRRKSAHR